MSEFLLTDDCEDVREVCEASEPGVGAIVGEVGHACSTSPDAACAVLFAVGDVLRHRFFGRCVVVGWASTCPMSEEWITGNRIRENLVNGPGQPFYHVLLEENHLPRCVSQENCALEAPPAGRKLVIPESFDHYGIPYYFSQTEAEDEDEREAGTDREMTISDELKQCYPEDDAFRISQDRDFRTLEEAHRPPYLRRAEEEA